MGPGAGAPVLYSIVVICGCVVVLVMGLFVVVMFVAGFGAAEAFRSVNRLEIRFPTQGAGSLEDRCAEVWRRVVKPPSDVYCCPSVVVRGRCVVGIVVEDLIHIAVSWCICASMITSQRSAMRFPRHVLPADLVPRKFS